MGTNDTKKWYTQILEACLAPSGHVSDVVFLKVFAAIMCVPCGSNYGKTGSDRLPGGKVSQNRRLPEEVWSDQLTLLDNYTQSVKKWEPVGETPKIRMEDLADILCSAHLNSEDEYTKKNSNYKPHNYLSLYLNAADPDAETLFRQVAELYGSVLSKVFRDQDSLLKQQLQKLEELFNSKVPDKHAPSDASDSGKMGYYVSALLLLNAAENYTSTQVRGLLHTLLGIEPPESSATLSVLSLENVPLKASQFNALCAAALRSDLDLEELQMIYSILSSIRKKVDGQLDEGTRMLVSLFIQAVRAFGERKSAAIKNDWLSTANDPSELEQARYLYTQCQDWLY